MRTALSSFSSFGTPLGAFHTFYIIYKTYNLPGHFVSLNTLQLCIAASLSKYVTLKYMNVSSKIRLAFIWYR